MSLKIILTAVLCSCISLLHAQNTGKISGKILDKISMNPLIGATVLLDGDIKGKGAVTDINGNFQLTVPYGIHSLQVSYMGYKSKKISDISVYDSKGASVKISLLPTTQQLDDVVVSAYKNPVESTDPLAIVSSRSISIEETKRFAGSLGDPSRMALSYAGVTSGRGNNNEIIIRGNSAKYLRWKLEGLEIPNPNHFGVYGSSGGLLSILNGNNLGRSNFYLGALPAHTGNALGGVFDLALRNGNLIDAKHSIEVSLIGLSVSSEGPLKISNGANYTINYRYSTLGLLKQMGVIYQAPDFQDLTFKINLPTKKAGSIAVYGMAGLGTSLEEDFFRKIDSTQFSYNSIGKPIYGYDEIVAANLNRYNIGIVGMKHTIPLNNELILTNHVNFSKVYSAPRSSGLNRDDFSIYLKSEGQFANSTFRYQPELNFYVNEHNSIHTGATLSFNSFYSKLVEGFPDYTTKTILENTDESFLGQSFITYKNTSIDKLSIISGLHYTYFNLNNQHIIEPRLGIDYQISSKTKIGFVTGLHSTTESPETYLIIDGLANNLGMSRSWQTVLSVKKKLAENMNLTVELYSQYLFNIPIASDSSDFSLMNEDLAFTDIDLINEGNGISYGLEITIEKFFSQSYYFLATASLFQIEYRLMEPFYRKSKYNNSYVINLLGGKEFRIKENKFFGLNLRTTFSGGKPYTPVLLEESIANNMEVRDVKRANYQQLPSYIGIDFSINYKWIHPKFSHELKLDIFRLFEQNYYDEIYVPERLNRDGSISPAAVKQVQYGEGQATTILPVLYYKLTF